MYQPINIEQCIANQLSYSLIVLHLNVEKKHIFVNVLDIYNGYNVLLKVQSAIVIWLAFGCV